MSAHSTSPDAPLTIVKDPPDPSRWGFALIATGIPLLATGAFFLLIGVMGVIIISVSVKQILLDPCSSFLLLLGLGLATAGGICLYIGRVNRAEGRKLAETASLLRAHRRIAFYTLAGKIGASEAEAENIVARCMALGILQGYIDREKNEFFTPEAILQARQIRDCPTCHGPIDQLRFLGEEFRCAACGAIL